MKGLRDTSYKIVVKILRKLYTLGVITISSSERARLRGEGDIMILNIGYLLILVGLLFILLESIIPGLYFPAVGISLTIYGVMLLYAPSLALPLALVAGMVTVVILQSMVYKAGKDIKIGPEKFIGREIILPVDLDKNGQGLITIDNEKWHIKGREPLKKGDIVRIVGIEGVFLVVEKVKG